MSTEPSAIATDLRAMAAAAERQADDFDKTDAQKMLAAAEALDRLAALEAFWSAFKDDDLHITADPYDDDQAAAWDRFYAAVAALDALEDQQ